MNKHIRVLHIDDSRLDRELVRDALEDSGFQITEATTREEFEKAFSDQDFDIVLSDFNILSFSGLAVIEIIKDKKPNLPIIIVTGTGSEDIAVEALKKGAADYIIKTPRHIRRLPNAILKVLEQKKSLDSLRESREQYRVFFQESVNSVFWLEMRKPVPVDLPIEEQVDMIFREAYIKDTSDSTIKSYGQTFPRDLKANFRGSSLIANI